MRFPNFFLEVTNLRLLIIPHFSYVVTYTELHEIRPVACTAPKIMYRLVMQPQLARDREQIIQVGRTHVIVVLQIGKILVVNVDCCSVRFSPGHSTFVRESSGGTPSPPARPSTYLHSTCSPLPSLEGCL